MQKYKSMRSGNVQAHYQCALKLHWQMKKEGLVVPARTIGEILRREGLVRKYRVKRVKYK